MTQIELTKDDTYHGNLILVTPDYPLMKIPCMEDMLPAIKEQPEIRMNEQAANLLQLTLAKIHCRNEIVAVSGFRTQEEQEKIWNDTLAESGLDFTKKYVAVPRHSEHQTGLAIDLAENKEQIDFICPHFPYMGIWGKFRMTAPRFGFVERYVSGKEQITGIGAEPWHFRYVGYPHSVIMTEKDMALEEYICFLKENTDLRHPYIYNGSKADKIEISYVFLDGGHSIKLDVSEMSPYMVSGTNEGGAILSRWGNIMRNKTFAGIDYFRLIAAFMVIAIHTSPLSVWNEGIDFLITYCVGRIAVPFFFMTTGCFVLAPYVFSNFKKKSPIHKYLVKNIRLYLIVTAIYIPISVYSGNIPHSIMELMKQLLFDGTFYHLWYFPAAVIGCILLACLTKKSILAAVYLSIIAYVIGIFGDSYYGIIENVPFLHTLYNGIFFVSSYTRNGIFFAPIYILLGMLLAVPEFHCRENICKWGLVLSSLFMLLEGWVTYSLNLQKHNSMYLFLLPVMYFLFQLLLNISGRVPAWIRGGSMMLYIIHPAVIIVVRGIAKVTRLTKILVDNTFIQYIFVCILSLIAAFCIQVFLERGNRNVPKRKSMD